MAADAATGRPLLDPTATTRRPRVLGAVATLLALATWVWLLGPMPVLGSVAARLDGVETGGVGTDEH